MLYYNETLGYHLYYEAGDARVIPGTCHFIIERWVVDPWENKECGIEYNCDYAYMTEPDNEQREAIFKYNKVNKLYMKSITIPESKYIEYIETLN